MYPSQRKMLRRPPAGATPAGAAPDAVRIAGLPLWALLGLVMLGVPAAAQEEGADDGAFQVVVNAANPTAELPANKVARMFLKKIKRWDHGVRVSPIDLELNSPIRKAFTRSVHGKSVTAINSFWQRMIFSGRDAPPAEKLSEQDVLDQVQANPGAIGYVAADTSLADGVKRLKVIP